MPSLPESCVPGKSSSLVWVRLKPYSESKGRKHNEGHGLALALAAAALERAAESPLSRARTPTVARSCRYLLTRDVARFSPIHEAAVIISISADRDGVMTPEMMRWRG